jgi:tetratricopeptide (TPR) repeat protein
LNKVSDVISTLNTDEIKKLSSVKWSPREKQLYYSILHSVGSPKKLEAVTAESLGITNSHFDKLSSVITEKIYNTLTSGRFDDVATFLVQKGLLEVLLHEMGLYERRLKSEKNPNVLKAFYLTGFEKLRRTSFDILDLKLFRHYANKLKQFCSDKDQLSPTVVEYKYVYVENAYQFLTGEGMAYMPKALAAIKRVGPEPTNPKRAEYALYHFCMAGHIKDFVNDQDTGLIHAQKTLDSARIWAPGEDESFLASSYSMYATILSHKSEFEKARSIYKEAFEKLPQHMDTNFYHVLMYSCIMLLCKDYATLEIHIKERMMPFASGNASLYFRLEVLRIKALLLLYQKKHREALVIIRELQSVKRKEMTVTADVFLRMIDNLYVLVTGDYEQTVSQSKKNMKYLRRKNYTYENCDYNHFFYCISAIAKMKQKGKVKPQALEPYLSKSREGFLRMYSGLFDQVM